MRNINLTAFNILTPDLVQFGFFPFKILYKFERTNGEVTSVKVYKRQPISGKVVWGLYSKDSHASSFYSMVRLEKGLYGSEDVSDIDVNWATKSLKFENTIDQDFKLFENSLKYFGERVCI